MTKTDLEKLILFGNVREDAAVCKAVEISGALYREGSSLSASDEPLRMYYEVQRELLSKYGNSRRDRDTERTLTYWKHHIWELIVKGENAFSLSSERGEFDQDLIALAAIEIPTLKALYELDWNRIAAVFGGEASCVANMRTRSATFAGAPDAVFSMRRANDAARALSEYYGREACGVFARYAAFRWERGLVGVEDGDPVSFDDLIGYERQKEQIIENANFFVSGKPYCNMLLYGDRGTGKSSSVKALLNMFKSRGLRLVALPKADTDALPTLKDALAPRGCKFIIFIDDLSFEENETGYKSFKSALEGGVCSQPANVMVCATSNRRNIIKEVWREREDKDEINLNDALQEKRSLADRFGLTVTFSAPDKSEYLDIVHGLARREGLEADENELAGLALQWELRHSGRSGRAARQFINYMLSRTAPGR
jgi:predicted AAA+ superfamily ATPase